MAGLPGEGRAVLRQCHHTRMGGQGAADRLSEGNRMTAHARSQPVALSPGEYKRWLNEYRRECPDLTGRSTLTPAERNGTRPFDIVHQPLDAHTIRHRNRHCRIWDFM